MIELERGPLERLDEDALRPFPRLPSFEGMVANALETQSGVDAGLGAAKLDVAGEGAPDLDGAFAMTVGVSADVLANQTGAEDDGRAATLSDRTDGAEAYRQAATPHLPQPEAPIVGDFNEEPPPEPGGGPDEGEGDRGNTQE